MDHTDVELVISDKQLIRKHMSQQIKIICKTR